MKIRSLLALVGLAISFAFPIFAQQQKSLKELMLFRSFLWLVAELAKVWDSQVELAGSMVGDGSEVDEVFESPGHSLC